MQLLLIQQLGSTNAQIHITAIARHVGIDLETDAWQKFLQDILAYGYQSSTSWQTSL